MHSRYSPMEFINVLKNPSRRKWMSQIVTAMLGLLLVCCRATIVHGHNHVVFQHRLIHLAVQHIGAKRQLASGHFGSTVCCHKSGRYTKFIHNEALLQSSKDQMPRDFHENCDSKEQGFNRKLTTFDAEESAGLFSGPAKLLRLVSVSSNCAAPQGRFK